MPVNYSKLTACLLAALTSSTVYISPSLSAQEVSRKTRGESRCFEAVQGKIAWNYEGNKNWARANVERLCTGAKPLLRASEPAKCFQQVMYGGVSWGGGTRWKWQNAISLCQGSPNAAETVSCFSGKTAQGASWADAIKSCKASAVLTQNETSCSDAIQGKIAWDYKGNKRWSADNIKRLCTGNPTSAEPAQCFNTAMHSGLSWGGGTRWSWSNAVNLCQGAKNSSTTISCFKNKISTGTSWENAINQCNGRANSSQSNAGARSETRTAMLKLPFLQNRQLVKYKLENNTPVYNGDIELHLDSSGRSVEPEPHPKKRDFSEFGRIGAETNGVASTTQSLVARVSDGIIDRNWLWDKGIIPYSIEGGDFSASERTTILEAIEELNTRTNLNIVPKWKVQNHVHFIKDTEMNAAGRSRVGRSRIYQRIRLNQNVSKRVIIHELLHAAGIWHEQSRRDRDRFIEIKWDNIQSGAENNFQKHDSDGLQVTPYDPNSIMHYGGFAFAINSSQPTIINRATGAPVGWNAGLSSHDIDGLNRLYPYDYYDNISRPLTSLRTLKLTVNRVQSNDRDGGAKHDIDFYVKTEIGHGWDWRPGGRSNSTERYKSGTREESDNDISPNWTFTHLIPIDEPYAKIWLQLRDDDGLARNERRDETVDINPFPTVKALELYVDTANGDIFLGNDDGARRDENYIGTVSDPITLEGFNGDIKAFINFQIDIE